MFIKKKDKLEKIREEWNKKGSEYTKGINEMVTFGEAKGWENWKGKEPEDKREHLAEAVMNQLRIANREGKTDEFREQFPPSHSPLVGFMEKQGQNIGQLYFIEDQKIIFSTGTSHVKRQFYLLNGDKITILDTEIEAVGKSKLNNVFAIAGTGVITTTKGWDGEVIETFALNDLKEYGITELIPFNDGKKVLFISSQGIYVVEKEKEILLHPVPDEEDEEWSSYISMENATISSDNNYIVVGEQCTDHRILNSEYAEIGTIGPQSSYPHFCLFSKDDEQLITNSCHFYNGITIGVDTAKLNGIDIPPYEESDDYVYIDESMRVYNGVATSQYYILGDAYGYIKAFDKKGNIIWRHFLGSTISGIAISDDEKTLWAGSYSGMLHKLQLGTGHRDDHTIGNGNHYEDFRLIIWKDEPSILKW